MPCERRTRRAPADGYTFGKKTTLSVNDTKCVLPLWPLSGLSQCSFRPENREQTAPAFPEARFFEGRRADLHIDIGSDSIFTPNNHNC